MRASLTDGPSLGVGGMSSEGVRPFRFTVCGDAPTADSWREIVRAAEDNGYTTLFVADHYHLPAGGGGYPSQHLAPIAAMMAAAAWTTDLQVGTRVACIDYHVPVALAKEAATIDALSNGRLVLGVGAGWHELEYAAMGIEFVAAPDRVQKLEEVVTVLKAHWSGKPFDFDGEKVQIHDFVGLPTPVRRPRPLLMIGGSKPRVLSLAGREADIVSLSNVIRPGVDVRSDIARQVEHVRAAAGPRFGELDFELMPVVVEITNEAGAALERVAGLFGVEPAFLRDHPWFSSAAWRGWPSNSRAGAAELGVNYVTVPAHFLDAMAPVVARLSGR